VSLASTSAHPRSNRTNRSFGLPGIRSPRLRRLGVLLAAAILLLQAVPAFGASIPVGGAVGGWIVDKGLSSGGAYVGFNGSADHPNAQNLTAAGPTDWKIWGRSQPSLDADDHKAGGSGISDLTDINANPLSLRALGPLGLNVSTGASSMPFSFAWSDGTTDHSGSGVKAGLQHNAPTNGSVGDGFSFIVPIAASGTHRVTVWASAHHGVGTMTGTITGTGDPVTFTNAEVSGGQNRGGVYTLDVAGNGTPRVLTVSYILTSAVTPPSTPDGDCPPGDCVSDDANVVVYAAALDAGTAAVTPDFSFGTPNPGGSSDTPLVVQQGASNHADIPVNLLGGAPNAAVSVLSVSPPEAGVSGSTNGTVTSTSIVTITATAGATPGGYTVVVRGELGDVSHEVTLHVNVPAPAAIGVPLLTNAYNKTGETTTLYAGRLTASPSTIYTIEFGSASTCHAGVFPSEGVTTFGSIQVTTDANGLVAFNPAHVTATAPNPLDGAPANGDRFIAARVNGPAGRHSGYSPCVVNSPDNDTWPRALALGAGTSQPSLGTTIDQPGNARWFKVPVTPGGQVTVNVTNPADYDVYLFADIAKTLSALNAEQNVTKLSQEFAGSGFSGSGFRGSGFSGSGFSGSGFSADSFSAAQVYSLIGWSNNLGTTSERVASNTWTSTGDFYIRVNGKNGVSDLEHPFTLTVTVDGNLCAGLTDPGPVPTSIPNSASSIILTDTSRFGTADTGAMGTKLTALATATGGTYVNLAADPRVHALQLQADAKPGCVYAKNLVAEATRDIIRAYRKGNTSTTPVKFIVLAGNDSVLPFFRYPDTSSIGTEVNYFPPVNGASPSEASLRSNYVLGQDAYGATTTLKLGPVDFPIPDLPVGRLVETPYEIVGMAQAYLDSPVVSPSSSLVTGYDFIADAANAIKTTLDAGTGHTGQALINNNGTLPAGGWTATQLKTALLNTRNDISFLGGHFSANKALAADFSTVMTTSDLTSSTTNLKNSIVFSIGCHSGYNIVDPDGVATTDILDWPQAFARKQVTAILGTGYQYGDTDIVEYSERIYSEFSKQLLLGTGSVAIGNALTAAKLQYLEQTPSLGDLHEKALLEATLYGVPMLGVNMLSGRGGTTPGATTTSPALVDHGFGLTTGLKSAELTQITPNISQPKTLNVQGGGTITATYLKGANGKVFTLPGAPLLPLYSADVTASGGYVLRGVLFTGGSYTDSPVTPLTGAPGTELQTPRTTFNSPVFYPSQMWTPNYFDALGNGTGTTLFMTPAQHRADHPGSDTVTLRNYSNLKLRLFYSNSTAEGSKAAAPAIYSVTSSPVGGATLFSAHVVGDPKADVQDVLVAYTEPNSGSWKSFALDRDSTDPSLWTASKTVADGTSYFVEAANGFGLVGVNDNLGAYFTTSSSTTAPAASTLALTAASSGAFGSSVNASATLTNGSLPLVNKLVVFSLGDAVQSGTTDANGLATASVPVAAGAGATTVNATFFGDTTAAPSSASAPFSVTTTASTTTITCPTGFQVATGAALQPCKANVTGAGGLNQAVNVSYTSNVNAGTATATAQFFGDPGHTASSATATFTIVTFYGFLQPVNDGARPAVCGTQCDTSIFKGGSTVPLKFQLKKADGTVVQMAVLPVWTTPVKGAATTAAVDETAFTDPATSGTQYRFDTGQYIYNWSTKGVTVASTTRSASSSTTG